MKGLVAHTVKNDSLSLYIITYKIITYLLAAILFVAAVAKLIDASALLNSLRLIPLLNETLIVWAATLLPVLEIALAGLLVIKWKPTMVLPGTLMLFTAFLAFSIYGMTMGWSSDCGCFGSLTASSFGRGMVLRNVFFLSLSVAATAIYYKHLREQE